MKKKRFIVLDTETTGTSVHDGHRIIEIGCVEIIDNIITDSKFHHYCNPEREIDPEALAVHKISKEFLLDKPKFSLIINDLMTFLQNGVEEFTTYIVAHNVTFDMTFLKHEFELCGFDKEWFNQFEIVDTVKLSRKLYSGQPANLNALCDRLGIDKSERDQNGHGALLDAKLLANVFLLLIAQRNIDELLMKQVDFIGFAKMDKVLPIRECFTLSQEELKLHDLFIKNNALAEW